MKLHLLPTRTAGAAENMAYDFLLLQRYPDDEHARFRHYDWRGPAFTFGYSQNIGFVLSTIEGPAPNLVVEASAPKPGSYDLCRRPTGGGIVDHRQDWTYALVIPRGHALEAERASSSYRAIHDCLTAALRLQEVEAALQPADPGVGAGAGVCFRRAEVHDVIHARTGEKIAGAAQKRNRRGLLFQGSIWRPAAGGSVDWERFHGDFTAALASALGIAPGPAPWPEFNDEEASGLVERYASPEWMESR